jgi:antitoxin (DNA-binding transcriptional repressor) of toxin-antitoxin stability system
MQVRISDVEIAVNFAAALAQVRQGMEVIVEQGHQPVAVLRAMEPEARTIREILALMPRESTGLIDEEFASDVDAAIERGRRS